MFERNAVVDTIPMRWLEDGQDAAGTPVVFLHGVPTSPELWRHVLPRLPASRRLAWEMVGFGGSIETGRDRDVSMSEQADYLVKWLRHNEIDRAVFVAHDLGGAVAQNLAVREPGRLAGLVFTNAVCYDSWPVPSVKAMQQLGACLRLLPDVAVYPAFVSLLRRGHDNRARASESIGTHWRHYATHGAARSLHQQVSALDVRDTLGVTDRLAGLNLPARVVWGAADKFQDISYGERLAHDLGTRPDRIDGGRHFVPEDHPDRVATAVREVLREIG